LHEGFSFSILRRYLDLVYGKKTSVTEAGLNYEEYYAFHDGDYRFVPYAGGSDGNGFLINYLYEGISFPKLSFLDVYNGNGQYDPKHVKDRIVIIGATATALHDEFFTPSGVQSGVFIHANAINTVLNRSYITNASKGIELALLGLLTFFFSLFLLHVGNRAYQVFVSILALVLASAFYIFIFWIFHKQFNYPIELSIIVIMVALSSTAYKYMLEEKGKRLLKNALSQYLAEDLVASVLSNYDQVRLGGDRREVTLFFSDIAGFTSISENMEPEELVRFLSVYLKEVSDVIMHQKGFINKYEGDAVMAILGAFREQDNQAYLACLSALEQQEKIIELNQEFQTKFGFEIQVRMGINKGPAIVGNIGSEGKKIEFTALGDTVNTASRFEGINKLYGTLVCVGESTMETAKGHFVFRKLDSLMVKGKEKPTSIYELVGRIGAVSDEKLQMVGEFERALTLYVEGDVSAGRKIFSSLWEMHRDPPSEVFMFRCDKLIENGVPEGWTGVYRATEK
jgi:adenylate cyclase